MRSGPNPAQQTYRGKKPLSHKVCFYNFEQILAIRAYMSFHPNRWFF